MEILVADGMSDDGTRELLRRYMETAPNVRMIDNPGKIVSTGLNAAIAASTGEVIIRMDAHTVYAADYVRRCVETLYQTGADNVGGPWVAEGRGLLGRAIAAAFRSRFCAGGGVPTIRITKAKSTLFIWAVGSAIYLRKQVLLTPIWFATRMTSSIFACAGWADASGSPRKLNPSTLRVARSQRCFVSTPNTDSGKWP